MNVSYADNAKPCLISNPKLIAFRLEFIYKVDCSSWSFLTS